MKAAYWYEKAAAQEVPEAQYNISICYLKGEGVEKDLAKAAYWLKTAADNGSVDAQNMLKSLSEIKTIPEDDLNKEAEK